MNTKYVRSKAAKLYDKILQGTPRKKAGYSEPKTIGEYEPHLQGPPQNRFGGHRTQQLCGLKGNTYGPAGPCRRLTPEERAKVEADLGAKGNIPPEETEPQD
jgi:hypothetical protein